MTMALSRRNFLARTGVVAAAVAVAHDARVRWPAQVQSADDLLGPLLGGLDPALQALAIDAVSGICAFLVPSTDEYSVAQGLTDDGPSAIAAANLAFMLHALDKKFLPLPDTAAAALARAFLRSTSDLPIPQEILDALFDGAWQLDDLLLDLIENDQTVPVALVIAGYVNLAASLVDPTSLVGPFVAPFANLAWEDKATAFAMIEKQHAGLVAAIDSNLPEPLEESVSGLLRVVPGTLLEFVGFGTFSEYHQFDPDNPHTLKGRPVEWDLTGYQEGMLTAGHGWDDFIGYHEDVQDMEGSWDRGQGVLGCA